MNQISKTPAHNKKRRLSPNDIKNIVIIIGAMKSGTTTLFRYLKQHVNILQSRKKEPSFFGFDSQWELGCDHYLKLWPKFDLAGHVYGMEASTDYTKAPHVPKVAGRIRQFGAQFGWRFRFIYILRDPVDRLESHIAHNIAMGRAGLGIGFEDAPFQRALDVSRYAYQLDAFWQDFVEAEILLLDFNEFRSDPFRVLEYCMSFLGLDPEFEFTHLAPANTRKTAGAAEGFRLGPEDRARIARSLHADVLRLRDVYKFDVSDWGIL